jgi:hypothetical protein
MMANWTYSTRVTEGWTDFNATASDGSLYVSRRRLWALLPVEVGQPIRLFDAEGNSCFGRVVSVSARGLRVMPDWATWSEPARLSPSAGGAHSVDRADASQTSSGGTVSVRIPQAA